MVNHDKQIHPKGVTPKVAAFMNREHKIKEEEKESEKTLIVRKATPAERKKFGIK